MANTVVDTAQQDVETTQHTEVSISSPSSHPALRLNPDTVAEVPSAEWGWSGEAPRAQRIAGWVVVLFLLAMLRGNHVGHVEDIFLVGFAAALAGFLLRDMWNRRKPQ